MEGALGADFLLFDAAYFREKSARSPGEGGAEREGTAGGAVILSGMYADGVMKN